MKNQIISIIASILIINAATAQIHKRCVLVFSARGVSLGQVTSFTGHAFVSWLQKSTDSDSACSLTTLGFFPEHEASIPETILGISANVEDGFEVNCRGIESEHLEIEVDSLTWYKTMEQAKTWNNQEYSLLTNNCVSFLDAVAKKVGMKTPSLKNIMMLPRMPKVYLKKLLQMNAKVCHPFSTNKL